MPAFSRNQNAVGRGRNFRITQPVPEMETSRRSVLRALYAMSVFGLNHGRKAFGFDTVVVERRMLSEFPLTWENTKLASWLQSNL
jgi:hypothetical protein